MTTKYPTAFIEQALVKVFSYVGKSIKTVADELSLNHHTLKYWMKNKSVTIGGVAGAKEKWPQDWTSARQFAALQATHGLALEALQSWCRARHLSSSSDELSGKFKRYRELGFALAPATASTPDETAGSPVPAATVPMPRRHMRPAADRCPSVQIRSSTRRALPGATSRPHAPLRWRRRAGRRACAAHVLRASMPASRNGQKSPVPAVR